MSLALLSIVYPWVKTLHVISVIAWMAGLLYLPRLFVYHAQVAPFSEAAERYKRQQRLLFRAIMNPAMVATWVFGGLLAATPGVVDWAQGWPWFKALGIVALTWAHHVFGYMRKGLAAERRRPSRDYRVWNEVPTIAMILIVLMVIARPF
ncbi:MAG: CopD family protein [Acetobacteraceae bacterium]|nr:CopD family protein [Acetobacteraceae bacterium]